jgi:hypothetical protein
VSIGIDKGKPPCQQQQQKTSLQLKMFAKKEKEILKLLSFPTAGNTVWTRV